MNKTSRALLIVAFAIPLCGADAPASGEGHQRRGRRRGGFEGRDLWGRGRPEGSEEVRQEVMP